MTQLLEKAFQQVSTLPETEQDRIAAWLMEELASEERWNKAFASSADKLASLAQEAHAIKKRKRRFGSAKGLIAMAPGFDEPLEDFKG